MAIRPAQEHPKPQAKTIRYQIRHVTTYQYSDHVSVCFNRAWLSPRELSHVQVLDHRITTAPSTTTENFERDFFGNKVFTFSVEQEHSKLVVTASSILEITQAPESQTTSPAWEDVSRMIGNFTEPSWFDARRFQTASPRIPLQEEFAKFARDCFPQGRPILEAVDELTERIYKQFEYNTTATTVETNPLDALTHRKGVCQDFAHVQIAALRSMGLPARYVSGYLRTLPPPGKPRLIGADQSHAWVSVYCGPDLGWIDFDPTNNVRCGLDHLTLAWGRDYSDVAPIKGVCLGGGIPLLNVEVDVVELPHDAN